LTVTAAPSQHFSGRGLKDRNATLWSSMVMRGERHAVFFSGDTGLTTEYAQIRERLGPFDLVMLEVGAFHPAWGDIHLGPTNALKAHALLGGGALLPVHWGTFSLAMHAWDEPVNTLLASADPATARLLMPRLGEAVEPAEQRPVAAWWRDLDPAAGGSKQPTPEPEVADPAPPRELPWPLD
jgi:L-ascorbate metabolism protein UlaG (beta-lactamase superfamily)